MSKLSKLKRVALELASQAYRVAQISYDPVSKTILADTGITGVRVNVGQEGHVPFFNNTGSPIANGAVINASGVEPTNNIVYGSLADTSSPATSSAIIGLCTAEVADGEWGLATYFGEVRDVDTNGLSAGGILWASSTPGAYTQTKPLYPDVRVRLGTVLKVGTTDGKILLVSPGLLGRNDISRSYNFTSRGVGSGTYYKAGFYDFATTSTTLSEASATIVYGTAGETKAAHAGIVPSGAGTVTGGGQVGLRVTGTQDRETGTQLAAQTFDITDDITTLTADTYFETAEKFSGDITFELYVVSGTPTAYSLTFNYGFAKYEDFANRDFTITSFETVWEGGATDSTFDVKLKKHTSTGWTYAASGFVPGNADICRRLTDQAIESTVNSGEDGAYKRIDLNEFIEGGADEGLVIEIATGANNTIQTMDMHVVAVSEELST